MTQCTAPPTPTEPPNRANAPSASGSSVHRGSLPARPWCAGAASPHKGLNLGFRERRSHRDSFSAYGCTALRLCDAPWVLPQRAAQHRNRAGSVMAFRRRVGRMRRLGCHRIGLLWKGLLLFLAAAFAGQLLGIIFNKSAERPPSLFSLPSMDSLAPPLGLCQVRTHVMFLKTHKTASSTVLNVLYRFGEERGLQFALPLGYQFGYPMHFIAHRVKGYRGPRAVEFSIMGNHMRFNKVEVEKVMPADTFYFSIIRDPVALAESSYGYYKAVAPAFKRSKGLADFASDPWRYYDPRLRNNHYARNLLWFDFGLDHNSNFSLPLAKRGEAVVRRSFSLILISEYFDESMVLLRHALCWPLDAVVSFSLNARQAGASRGSFGGRLTLTEEQKQKLREWNALDWHLYVSFNRTFWEKVELFGKARMDTEVALLRTRRGVMARICLQDDGRPVEASRIQDKAIRPFQSGMVKILGYMLRSDLDNATYHACLRMIRPEIQYKDFLDAKQFPRPLQPSVLGAGSLRRELQPPRRAEQRPVRGTRIDLDRLGLGLNQTAPLAGRKRPLR
ncbi:galactose-3-O-sulfotransferase 4 isoform X1 [Paramormyrops kingsleyae]|uniref:Galactose-3-O-sulfotransferase 4 n=3 Tax=Paramormyrops kingsleyae TaxID=1676925 RepID=A0A3B3R947_9TELE|nr:galactose-3-O-sulfotransferase 4 isoform X1 [Paramormyrops kingsleyae]